MSSVATLPLPAGAGARPRSAASLLPWVVLAVLAAFPLIAPAFGLEYYIGFVR